MNFSFSEIRLIIAKSTTNNNMSLPYLKSGGIKPKIFSHRISLIKTLKTYIKKYCQNSDKYDILYLSILYLDIILSKNKISLSHDKNLKYLCLCCFLLSLKLIGNYDISKKIISNFCRNYKQEYKIFETQCLILLEHNLVYTTTYDYLNLLLIKEPKKLLSICNKLLYQICEESIYTIYSPFYVSIAILQIAKTSINDNSHNHYDKYFHDERVKYLIKKINYVINPPPIKTSLLSERNIKKEDIDLLNNTINNNNANNANNANINIITNNNIQNNIVIINTISKKNSDNNFNKNYSLCFNNRRTAIKFNIKDFTNKKNLKISKNENINTIDENRKNNTESNQNEYEVDENIKSNINSASKNNDILSNSEFKFCRNNEINNIYHNHKTITIKQTNIKRPKYKIASYINNPNYFSNNSFSKNNFEKNSFELKRQLYNNSRVNTNKEESLSTDIQTPNDINRNLNKIKRKAIFTNKSTLNFQLVSGVSKEKLVKLSRNISKSMVKDSVNNLINKKNI